MGNEKQRTVAVVCHLEGNHRSGSDSHLGHRLCDMSMVHLWVQWANKGSEHPTYIPLKSMTHYGLAMDSYK